MGDSEDDFVDEDDVLEEYEIREDSNCEFIEEIEDSNKYEGNEYIVNMFLHESPVYSVRLHPHLPYALTGGGDDKCVLWSFETGQSIYNSKFGDSVGSVGFSRDGKYILATSLKGEIMIQDLQNNNTTNVQGPEDINWIDWHPNKYIFSVGSEDGTVWTWDVLNGECIGVCYSDGSSSKVGGFSRDGKTIVSGYENGKVKIWSFNQSRTKNEYGSPHPNETPKAVHALAFGPENLVISGGDDCCIRLLLLNKNRTMGTLNFHNDSVESISISDVIPNLAVSAGMDGKLVIFDVEYMKQRSLCTYSESFTKTIIPENSMLVLTSSVDGVVGVWDIRTGNLERKFQEHEEPIFDFDCKHDKILTGSEDGYAIVFQLSSSV